MVSTSKAGCFYEHGTEIPSSDTNMTSFAAADVAKLHSTANIVRVFNLSDGDALRYGFKHKITDNFKRTNIVTAWLNVKFRPGEAIGILDQINRDPGFLD